MPTRPSWSRETRLLLLTIVVSAGVLLMLARFRFPDEPSAPPPQPLERLAARATFDELAGIVERLDRTIAPSLVVLEISGPESLESRTLSALLRDENAGASPTRFAPALRVRPTAALAFLDAHETVRGIVGNDSAVPIVVARDPVRRLALVRVPASGPETAWQWRRLAPITAPRYTVSIEGSRQGSAPAPYFFGRADRFMDFRWPQPLVALGRSASPSRGAFVFSIQGELIGLVMPEGEAMALVPADALEAAANRLFESGTPRLTDFGLAVRQLGPQETKARGATSGLVITAVERDSIADGHLRVDDLIQAVDGRPAVDPDGLLLDLADTPPDTAVVFTVRRDAEVLDVPVTTPSAMPVGQAP